MTGKTIWIYENWSADVPKPLGALYVDGMHGREVYSFEFQKEYLARKENVLLDPAIANFAGRQHAESGMIWGFLADSCPDRWGRTLMKKREALLALQEGRKPRVLRESDFLLGVHDGGRMGALRFCIKTDGPFLDNDDTLAAPPWVALRELESATAALENEDENEVKWLNMLLAPGSSLGGARPKATVTAPDGSLWIAKFPSKHDESDVGAWEMVAHDLATECGLNTPPAKLASFSKNGSTFLVKRFDRQGNRRVHFASAMTMLGKHDNDHDSSYLDIAGFLREGGAMPAKDLHELWKRMVFNMLISNTDDHLRNHGFLLTRQGWKLAPLYDVNPIPYGQDLSLGVTYEENTISLELAYETAEFYGIKAKVARDEVKEMASIVQKGWQDKAQVYHISRSSIEKMAPAFGLANRRLTH